MPASCGISSTTGSGHSSAQHGCFNQRLCISAHGSLLCAQADAQLCHAQVVYPSSVHHKGPVEQGMVLNVRDIAKAPRITIDEPQARPAPCSCFHGCQTHSTSLGYAGMF